MKKLIILALILIALVVRGNPTVELSWTFVTYYRDVLEVFDPTTSGWRDVPGPYPLSPDRRLYRVPRETNLSGEMFRVRRDFGLPWLNQKDLARLLGGSK